MDLTLCRNACDASVNMCCSIAAGRGCAAALQLAVRLSKQLIAIGWQRLNVIVQICSALDSPTACWGVTSPHSASSGSAIASRQRTSTAPTPQSARMTDRLQAGPDTCNYSSMHYKLSNRCPGHLGSQNVACVLPTPVLT